MRILSGVAEVSPGAGMVQVIAVVVSSIAALCAIMGVIFTAIATARAGKAEGRAKAAEARSQRAEERAIKAEAWAEEQRQFSLWGDAIAALQEMVTYHAMTPEIPAKIMNLRIALTELSDGLPAADFPRIDEYMAGIHGVSAIKYERSLFIVMNQDGSPASVAEAHEPVVQWLSACIGNLRLLRRTRDAEKRAEWIEAGIANCEKNYAILTEQKSRNWDIPEGYNK